MKIHQKYAFKILLSRKNHKDEFSTFKVEGLFRKYIKRMSFEIRIMPIRKILKGTCYSFHRFLLQRIALYYLGPIGMDWKQDIILTVELQTRAD